jgi:hypothetical protein
LILGLLGEKVAEDVEVSSVLFEHKMELLDLIRGPQLRLLFSFERATAGERVSLAQTEIRLSLRLFLYRHSCT